MNGSLNSVDSLPVIGALASDGSFRRIGCSGSMIHWLDYGTHLDSGSFTRDGALVDRDSLSVLGSLWALGSHGSHGSLITIGSLWFIDTISMCGSF